MRVLLVMLLVACSSRSPEVPLTGHSAPHKPQGPAPTVGFSNANFDTTGLPAIARSRDLVVLAISDNDSARGNPNLRLELRDRRDKLVETIAVMSASEFETLVPDAFRPGPLLESRIRTANKKLATLHADYDLIVMQEYGVANTIGRDTPIEGDGLSVTFFDDNVLRVRRGDQTLITADGSAWLAPKGQRCAQCPVCENPPYLTGMYKAATIDAVVVRIAYQGNDTCWEPPDQLHVVTW